MNGFAKWGAAALAVAAAGAVAYVVLAPGREAGRAAAGSADPRDARQVAAGKAVYAAHCARCHGIDLEGEANWRRRNADGRLPAPPHDASGHTWHHSDADLFRITRDGVQAFAGADYESDMPAFAGVLSDDEIWAVLAFIKSTWPEREAATQAGLNRQ